MSRIIYRAGDLFDAPAGEMLVHAVNCQGVWGSGVAAEFRKRFQDAHQGYKRYCEWAREEGFVPRGSAIVESVEGVPHVVCLFTSDKYGADKDPPEQILQSTHSAIAHLFSQYPTGVFNSPRINSGLFNVPWPLTEQIIEDALRVYPGVTWTVWTGK